MSDKIIPCIWYNGAAEEAATFYASLLPDSRVDSVNRSPVDTTGAAAGAVLTVEFTLAGRSYLGLNGGSLYPHTEAVSFQIMTDDQAETDRLWNALIANGGKEIACSWLKDRWGLRWQIVPRRLMALIKDPDAGRARRAMTAMMSMTKIDIAALERAVLAA